jgi:hypothetical protein
LQREHLGGLVEHRGTPRAVLLVFKVGAVSVQDAAQDVTHFFDREVEKFGRNALIVGASPKPRGETLVEVHAAHGNFEIVGPIFPRAKSDPIAKALKYGSQAFGVALFFRI